MDKFSTIGELRKLIENLPDSMFVNIGTEKTNFYYHHEAEVIDQYVGAKEFRIAVGKE